MIFPHEFFNTIECQSVMTSAAPGKLLTRHCKKFFVMDNLRVKTVRVSTSSWRGFRKGSGWNIFRKTFAFIRSFVVWHCCEWNLHSRKINKRVNKYFPFDKFDSLMKFLFALVNYNFTVTIHFGGSFATRNDAGFYATDMFATFINYNLIYRCCLCGFHSPSKFDTQQSLLSIKLQSAH